MNNIKVVKRNGETENFKLDKLYKVAKATGLNHKQSVSASQNTAEWIMSQKLKKVSTLIIRKRFYRELLKYNEYSASLYAWYQKLKDKAYTSRFEKSRYK